MSWHGDDEMNRQHELWDDDEALALDLAAATAEAGLHGRVAAAGLRAFGIQRQLLAMRSQIDLLILDLVHDSMDHEALVPVRDRSGDTSRSLVFEGLGMGVEIELTDDRVEGQLIPAHLGHVTLQGPEGEIVQVTTDDVGYFRLEVRPHGPVQLICSSDDGACATRWLTW